MIKLFNLPAVQHQQPPAKNLPRCLRLHVPSVNHAFTRLSGVPEQLHRYHSILLSHTTNGFRFTTRMYGAADSTRQLLSTDNSYLKVCTPQALKTLIDYRNATNIDTVLHEYPQQNILMVPGNLTSCHSFMEGNFRAIRIVIPL